MSRSVILYQIDRIKYENSVQYIGVYFMSPTYRQSIIIPCSIDSSVSIRSKRIVFTPDACSIFCGSRCRSAPNEKKKSLVKTHKSFNT